MPSFADATLGEGKRGMSDMIALDNLSKHFGSLVAVDGISLAVGKGEVLGFLGPNGAGKSTTMKMITGFLLPTGGTARVGGSDVVAQPVEVKKRLGYLPEGAPTYGDMTPASFLDFIAEVRGLRGAERRRAVDRVVETVALQNVFQQPIETLSKGFKRRVGLAQAMIHDPEVLILDEPTDGLDPNQKHHVRELIREMAADKCIVISTHILEEVEAVCSRAVVIAHGRLLADGTAAELQARAPYHNAVSVRMAAGQADKARSVLGGLAGVRGIEALESVNGTAHLRILPEDGQAIVARVAEALSAGGIQAEEVYVERGRLDDVFRHITVPEGEQAHA